MPRRSGEAIEKRVNLGTSFGEHLDRASETNERTEALRLARTIALAGLPKRPLKARDLTRTLRLGTSLWLRVTYMAAPGSQLPYGEDRFVLAGIQHLAVTNNSPAVSFERVGQLLALFHMSEDGRTLRLLRERFRRLSGFAIRLTFAETEGGLNEAPAGEQLFVIRRYLLPTRQDLLAERQGQMALPTLSGESSSPYGVLLSGDFWEHLRDTSNQLVMPLALLRLFVDRPVGWDYCCFLISRCGSARTESVVPHEALISLFRDGQDDPDRNVIARLQRYHREIMLATRGYLKARLVQDGFLPGSGRGRPRKRWVLKISPSKPVISGGRRGGVLALPA